METKATKLSSIGDRGLDRRPTPPTPEAKPSAARITEGVEDQTDLRLVIEEQDGSYVYKTVDRRTGDVLAQYPREELLKMQEEDDYTAGTVIRAKI